MPLPRASRARLVWALELSLGLELYACAVLALHARGLRATPLEASPALVLPALVIPPVFYVLVALVSVRPLALARVVGSAASMCGLHALLVMATGALFMIPDLLDYGAAVAFALWGSPAVTLLQLTASPLVFARLRPLVSSPRAPRADGRAAPTPRRLEAVALGSPARPLAPADTPSALASHASVLSAAGAKQREPVAPPPAQLRPPALAPVPPQPRPAVGRAALSESGRQTTAPRPAAPREASRSFVRPPAAVTATPAATLPASIEPRPSAPSSKRALDWTEPMIRVPFVRIADQLPVEMFLRGREGLKDTLRPGVSLLVPRKLLLPHLGEGLAPVKWEVVADQFPLDELAVTHEEIAERLPDGSLLLPLDEVVPQIPPGLLALSTPPPDVREIEEFPVPFQPHDPGSPEPVAAETSSAPGLVLTAVEEPTERVTADREETSDPVVEDAAEVEEPDEITSADTDDERQPELAFEAAGRSDSPEYSTTPEPLMEHEPPAYEAPATLEPATDNASEAGRSAQTRRIAALLSPLLNGLEIGRRDGAGTALVTVVAPTLSEDDVVRTAVRVVPFLTDARLREPVIQATVTAVGATVVLTPFGASDTGALLVTAMASRASLAWLERLSRTAAREAEMESVNGAHSRPDRGSEAESELRVAAVPATVRELAGSLTSFGPVAPTLLRDRAGELSACLFLPSSLDALPLARFARDLHAELDGAEIGRVASVILKLGAHRVILRLMASATGHVTMLVGGGRIDRPGLARIELDRAAMQLPALVQG
jgi:hypothetical protein